MYYHWQIIGGGGGEAGLLGEHGVATTPGPTGAQALVKFVCALVKLFYLAQHHATWSPVLQHQNYIAATEFEGCSY